MWSTRICEVRESREDIQNLCPGKDKTALHVLDTPKSPGPPVESNQQYLRSFEADPSLLATTEITS